MNAPEFWAVRKDVHGQVRRSTYYEGVDEAAPADAAERDAQARANFSTGAERPAHAIPELTDWLTDRLLEVAATVPETSTAST